MDVIKERYVLRFHLYLICLIASIVGTVFAFMFDRTVFFIIALFILDFIFGILVYHGTICMRLLLTSKEAKYSCKLDLTSYFQKKEETKQKVTKRLNLVLKYSLYAFPGVVALFVLLGIFVFNSLFLSIVLPALIITYILFVFFFKEVYANRDIKDFMEVTEEVYLNDKILVYMDTCYILNGYGFKLENEKQKFLKMSIGSLEKTDEEVLKKVDELTNEVCDK